MELRVQFPYLKHLVKSVVSREVLRELLQQKIKELSDSGVINENHNKVRVKLSGDGTNVGKRIYFVNFTCVILNETETLNSAKGNYPIADNL